MSEIKWKCSFNNFKCSYKVLLTYLLPFTVLNVCGSLVTELNSAMFMLVETKSYVENVSDFEFLKDQSSLIFNTRLRLKSSGL
jgi:hypothetical protein